MTANWSVVVLMLLACCCMFSFLFIAEMRAEKSRRRRICSRAKREINDWHEEFCHHFDGINPQLLEDVLTTIGEAFDVPPTSLQPQDRFSHELALDTRWGIEDDSKEQMEDMILERFGIKWNYDWTTIEDVVRGIAFVRGEPTGTVHVSAGRAD